MLMTAAQAIDMITLTWPDHNIPLETAFRTSLDDS